MPIYTYKYCDGDPDPETFIERNVPIEERDNQFCHRCKNKLERVIDFNGSVWAPTAGGMK